METDANDVSAGLDDGNFTAPLKQSSDGSPSMVQEAIKEGTPTPLSADEVGANVRGGKPGEESEEGPIENVEHDQGSGEDEPQTQMKSPDVSGVR